MKGTPLETFMLHYVAQLPNEYQFKCDPNFDNEFIAYVKFSSESKVKINSLRSIEHWTN